MKSVLTAILTIALVSVLVGAGTFAYFTDTEMSSGNMFTAGTLDLKVSDDDEGFGEGVSTTWIMNDMEPGVTGFTNFVTLVNSGNVAGNHVEISFSHSLEENGYLESDTNSSSAPGDMAKWIEITSCSYDGVILALGNTGTLSDANANGWIDLQDVTMSPNTDVGGPLDNLLSPLPNSVGSQSIVMSLYFRPEATNDIQGDTLTTTVTFTLNQDLSQ